MKRRSFLKGTIASAIASCIPLSVKALAEKFIPETTIKYFFVGDTKLSNANCYAHVIYKDSLQEAAKVAGPGDYILVSSMDENTIESSFTFDVQESKVVIHD